MKKESTARIIYSINVGDIQEVSRQILQRPLTNKELFLVEGSVGDYIDWFQSIEDAISKHVTK
jgi:hypothetical protein